MTKQDIKNKVSYFKSMGNTEKAHGFEQLIEDMDFVGVEEVDECTCPIPFSRSTCKFHNVFMPKLMNKVLSVRGFLTESNL